jgi:hypothetical protein
MIIRLRAEDEPTSTRADYWQHVVGASLAPYQLRATGDTLRSEICQTQIGTLTVLDSRMSTLQTARTPDLIRKSEAPEGQPGSTTVASSPVFRS